jgi:hypothetical protein
VCNLQPCLDIFATKVGKKQDIPFAISVSNRFMITPNGGAYVPIEILPGIPAFQMGVFIPNLDCDCDLT